MDTSQSYSLGGSTYMYRPGYCCFNEILQLPVTVVLIDVDLMQKSWNCGHLTTLYWQFLATFALCMDSSGYMSFQSTFWHRHSTRRPKCQSVSHINFFQHVTALLDLNETDRRECPLVTVKPRLHDTTCCQTGCQTDLTTGCIVSTAGCHTGCTTRFDKCSWTNSGCSTRLSNRLSTTGFIDIRFDNRLYRCKQTSNHLFNRLYNRNPFDNR